MVAFHRIRTDPLRERYLWLWSEWVPRARGSERIASGRYLEVCCEELCADNRGTGEERCGEPIADLLRELDYA